MRIRVVLLALPVLIVGAALAQQPTQQTQSLQSTGMQQAVVVSPEGARLTSAPNVPDCFNYTVEHGDPKGSGSVMLVQLSSGCVVPSHWHSANEQLIFASGKAQLLMRGEQPQAVGAGTYAYLPAHHVHQLTCTDRCTFYRMVDGPSDIHYVDAAGNEIATVAALAAFGERPGTAIAPK
jgi:quercetin dioxygenase-like cupin family protein